MGKEDFTIYFHLWLLLERTVLPKSDHISFEDITFQPNLGTAEKKNLSSLFTFCLLF